MDGRTENTARIAPYNGLFPEDRHMILPRNVGVSLPDNTTISKHKQRYDWSPEVGDSMALRNDSTRQTQRSSTAMKITNSFSSLKMEADTFLLQTLTSTNQTTRSHIPVPRVKGWICTRVIQVQSPSHARTHNSYTPQCWLSHPHNTANNILLNSEIICCWRNMTHGVDNLTPSGEHAQYFTWRQTHKYLQIT